MEFGHAPEGITVEDATQDERLAAMEFGRAPGEFGGIVMEDPLDPGFFTKEDEGTVSYRQEPSGIRIEDEFAALREGRGGTTYGGEIIDEDRRLAADLTKWNEVIWSRLGRGGLSKAQYDRGLALYRKNEAKIAALSPPPYRQQTAGIAIEDATPSSAEDVQFLPQGEGGIGIEEPLDVGYFAEAQPTWDADELRETVEDVQFGRPQPGDITVEPSTESVAAQWQDAISSMRAQQIPPNLARAIGAGDAVKQQERLLAIAESPELTPEQRSVVKKRYEAFDEEIAAAYGREASNIGVARARDQRNVERASAAHEEARSQWHSAETAYANARQQMSGLNDAIAYEQSFIQDLTERYRPSQPGSGPTDAYKIKHLDWKESLQRHQASLATLQGKKQQLEAEAGAVLDDATSRYNASKAAMEQSKKLMAEREAERSGVKSTLEDVGQWLREKAKPTAAAPAATPAPVIPRVEAQSAAPAVVPAPPLTVNKQEVADRAGVNDLVANMRPV